MSEVIDQVNAGLAGRYALQRELGRGGMATVFLAEDLRHHRPVAIKVLHPELAATLGSERFLREIEVAARLNHPHILPLHESGSAGDLLYYVMPFAAGESLRQRLEREKQLPLADALRIAREVADALDYAHRHGVVHRDIKPENILLDEHHAVVADFGIARAIAAAGREKLTTTGVVIGTPAYMSPEQAAGSRDLDGRSDLYSLGCLLYEMLAGQPPFTGPTAESLAHQHLNVAPRPVTELRPTVPEEVARAIHLTLAKAAADRYSTASEFATAVATIAEPATAEPRPEGHGQPEQRDGQGARRRGHRARPFTVAVGVVVIALFAVAVVQKWGPFSRWLGGSSTAHAAKKDWILVAEFDGPPEDSTLAVTTRDLVSGALDQSEIVATVPREQIRLALQTAGKPMNTRVDAELAKELAYRSAVRAVVEGTIGRLGRGYSVVLRVVDAESLKVVLTERAIAKDEDALIPTLGRLAEKLRAGLGEKRGAIQASRPMYMVATPSLEAYRLYVQAWARTNAGEAQNAIPLFREALALDPDFANAWRGLGVSHFNLGQLDSALTGLNEAVRRPQRLSTVQRLIAEADRVHYDGDLPAALAAYERVLQYDPGNRTALVNSGVVLDDLGHTEETLERNRAAARVGPFGVTQIIRWNESEALRCLGRFDEAREVVRSMGGYQGRVALCQVEASANNWAAAESIAVTLLGDPGFVDPRRRFVPIPLATAQAARGALKAAAATLEHVEEADRGATGLTWRQYAARHGRLMLAVVSEGAIALPRDTWSRDSAAATLLTRGLRAAIAGGGGQARSLLIATRSRSTRELTRQGAAPALLEARIEALAGRWDEAAHTLQPIASQRKEIGQVVYPVGMSAIRWFLADAFEQLGRPDSAAFYLERITTDPSTAAQEIHLRGIVLPFAHRRLVMLYARMGRIEDARRHWQIFSATVRTPDPEIEPLIAEARAALMSAEGMAKSARR